MFSIAMSIFFLHSIFNFNIAADIQEMRRSAFEVTERETFKLHIFF